MSEAADHFRRGNWQAAYEAWSEAGLDGLGADELEQFSTAAGLVGHHDELVGALQRAFLACQEEGDLRGAARCAFHLSMNSADHGEHALAGGWAARAADLVAEIGEDCVEGGWVAFLMMFRALGEGDLATARSRAAEALEVGRRLRDPDLTAMSTCAQGRVSIMTCQFAAGLAQLDDAMVRVLTDSSRRSSPGTSTAPPSREPRRSATSAASPSGPRPSNAGAPRSPGCSRSPASAPCTAAS